MAKKQYLDLAGLETYNDEIQSQLSSKANSSDLTSHTGNKSNPHGVTKAQVGLGNVENKSSATIRGELTKANVTAALGYTPPTTNTTYGVVSTTADGLAPKRDGSTTKYLRADGTWATPPDNNTVYTHPTSSGNKHIPSGGSSGQILRWYADGTAVWGADNNITYTFATGDGNGQIKITPSSGGGIINVPVKGLGTAAYTNSANYLASANPTGTGSLSMNRKASTTVGSNSVAVGSNTTASGNNSHAEGSNTTASGNNSHAEGSNTTASGHCSHAEGYGTTASGDYSHASGYGTVAAGDYQFVIGKFNDNYRLKGTENDYAFIIGNGTDADNGVGIPSNAFTVKWDGDVEAANHFIVPNSTSFSGYDTSGVRNSLLFIDSDNDVHLGSDVTGTNCHSGDTYVNAPKGGIILNSSSGVSINKTLAVTGISTIQARIQPKTDDSVQLGTGSLRFINVYCMKSTMNTSDLNAKRDLAKIDDRYIELFDLIEPYTFYFTKGDRVHTGFISQYVEEAMEQVGLTAEELGFFCKDIKCEYFYDDNGNYVGEEEIYDEDGNPVYVYSLRYSEYIAIMAEKIKRLEKKYNSKIEEYDNKLAELDKRLAILEG